MHIIIYLTPSTNPSSLSPPSRATSSGPFARPGLLPGGPAPRPWRGASTFGASRSPRLPSARLHQLGLVVRPRGGRCRQQLLRKLVLPERPARPQSNSSWTRTLQWARGLRLGLLREQLAEAAAAAEPAGSGCRGRRRCQSGLELLSGEAGRK